MSDINPFSPEEDLDPQDWAAFRQIAHQMVDEMMEYLETVRQRPAWQPAPEEVKDFFHQPAPQAGQPVEQVYADFQRFVLPYPMGNIHPRFWGWVIGTGTPLGVMAEMLAATMNPNVGGGDHIAPYVESQVIDWCKEMLGYPAEASGILVSGGSMANLVGLAVARNQAAGFDVRRVGLGAAPAPLRLYASVEAHSSIRKAVELMGLGSAGLCYIPVDADFRIDLAALETAIAADRAGGLRPFCVVGNAGTVNTGAIDDLQALADICAREGLWFHVDGAFGALAALSPELRPRVAGIERADSLSFDLHKWVYLPFDVGVILVRDAAQHLNTFTLTPAYLEHHSERGPAAGAPWYMDYSYETTRRFRALKVWMCFKEQGLEKIGRVIQQNVDQARYLELLVEADPNLENVAPVPLNVVNFRFCAEELDDEALNELNEELLTRLQESGAAVPSSTRLHGKTALHVAITNHRSRREDFDVLVREVVRIGKQLMA
jgi:glutamate/tyrosine decarboxylase-like PLP-dependent enzyme